MHIVKHYQGIEPWTTDLTWLVGLPLGHSRRSLWFYSSIGYATSAVMNCECWYGVLYLQQDSTCSGQQWSAFLPPQWITLHPFRHPADMLSLDLDPISIVL